MSHAALQSQVQQLASAIFLSWSSVDTVRPG